MTPLKYLDTYLNPTDRTMFHLSASDQAAFYEILNTPTSHTNEFWPAYRALANMTASAINPHTGEPFTRDEHTEHATIGFITEIGELLDICKKYAYYGRDYSPEHIVEELGDLIWYAMLWHGAQEAPIGSFYLPYNDGYDITAITPPHVECLIALAKDQHIPKHRHGIWMLESASRIYSAFTVKAQVPLPSWREIARMNIVKLHKGRYQDGVFTAEAANNRDLAAEDALLGK